jgi:LmbE family N-acetylglucosaminyl deacetylase
VFFSNETRTRCPCYIEMRLSLSNDRVLAVMAHPDDAELLCAGTLARAKADGAAIGICVMCRGDKGVPAGTAVENLAAMRRAEAQAAANLLDATLLWFNCGDGELMDSFDNRRRLIELYRQFRPTLVLAHSPEDYHPDHRAAGVLAEAASWFAASRGHVTETAALEQPPALWWCDTIDMQRFVPQFFVDITPHLELKERMLACHRSQLQRAGDADFCALRELMFRQASCRGAQAGTAAAEAFAAHHAIKRTRAW